MRFNLFGFGTLSRLKSDNARLREELQRTQELFAQDHQRMLKSIEAKQVLLDIARVQLGDVKRKLSQMIQPRDAKGRFLPKAKI